MRCTCGSQSEEIAPTDPGLPRWPTGTGSLGAGAVLSDRYRVMDLIGAGASSRVYLAEQLGLGRRVVLKTIHAALFGDPQNAEGFLQEARVLARVNHPNIVTVYGVGETASGERYIAMEYVSGESLADLLARDGRPGLGRTVSMLLQLSRALGAVHREGVIHRDLKPDNVLITNKRSGLEIAKVADFGLAKLVNRKARPGHRNEHRVVGTPSYMAPEQIASRRIDHRADLYSLGCIAYEMLTGAPPFTGPRASVLSAHLHEPAVPLREACPSAGIPACFQPFIDRALAKDPRIRFGSAFEMYAALLTTADAAGIPRRELRLVESLFDDPAYAIVHERARRLAAKPPPRRRPRTRWLPLLALATGGLLLGLGVGRLRGNPATGDNPSAMLPPGETARIVITAPAGEYAAIDRAHTWKQVPTSFDAVLPGHHDIYIGRPDAVRFTIPVELDAGEVRVVREPGTESPH